MKASADGIDERDGGNWAKGTTRSKDLTVSRWRLTRPKSPELTVIRSRSLGDPRIGEGFGISESGRYLE